MTHDEFSFQYKRLCDGTKHETTVEQGEAWFSRVMHVRSDDWREAVTILLLRGKFPYPEQVTEAIDQAISTRKLLERRTEHQQAKSFFTGKTKSAGATEPERAYNAFRMRLLLQSMKPDFSNRCESRVWREDHPGEACPDCTQRMRELAAIHANALADWISIKEHADWAMSVWQGPCVFHSGDHSLHRCLSDEFHYWQMRAEGKTDRDAKAELFGVLA